MRWPEPGMLPDVADFAVITPALDETARHLIGIEPFEELAALSHSLIDLSGPRRTAAALEALVVRCTEALANLSTRTQAIADTTMMGARSYETMENSILHTLTTFPPR